MKKQALNFLWINLEFPAKPHPYADKGYIYNPIPSEYIENMQKAAKTNSDADVFLWVDSKRLTPLQYQWLKATIAPVKLQDLRSIPEYNKEVLYNQGDNNTTWREDAGKKSIIWQQVDAAKILIALQGKYVQSFFVDMDHAHIKLNNAEVQKRINKYGFLIGQEDINPPPFIHNMSESLRENIGTIENQFFAITPRSKLLFKALYKETIKTAHKEGDNGWLVFKTKFEQLIYKKKTTKNKVAYTLDAEGSPAYQPGASNAYGVYDVCDNRTVLTSRMLNEPSQIKVTL